MPTYRHIFTLHILTLPSLLSAKNILSEFFTSVTLQRYSVTRGWEELVSWSSSWLIVKVTEEVLVSSSGLLVNWTAGARNRQAQLNFSLLDCIVAYKTLDILSRKPLRQCVERVHNWQQPPKVPVIRILSISPNANVTWNVYHQNKIPFTDLIFSIHYFFAEGKKVKGMVRNDVFWGWGW